MPAADQAVIGDVFRREHGRVVAGLVRFLGDIDLAEEAVQDAFAVALERWPRDGLPPNPGAWITTTAKRRAIDYVRRESARPRAHEQALLLSRTDEPGEVGPVHDDRLRLIFTCCHPALGVAAQVALTLRLLGGLTTPEVARAFLVPEATMAQRLVRAKKKISAARIPYRIPDDSELPARLPGVLAVVYLIFTEGHNATSGADVSRPDLCAEALRLARLLHDLMPDDPEVAGLYALLLLTDARRPARTGPDGSVVLLSDQDRGRWNREQMRQGQEIVRACLRRGQRGPYQIQAAIAAVHSDARSTAETDWRQVLTLYDQLLALQPTPVVALNRAVALAEVAGPAAALAVVEDLDLPRYHLAHATRADLLRRLGRAEEAAEAYAVAAGLTERVAEQTLLLRRRDEQRRTSELSTAAAPAGTARARMSAGNRAATLPGARRREGS